MSPSKCRVARPPTTQGRRSVEGATKMNTSPNGQPWTTLSLFEVPPKSRAPNVSRLLNRPSGHGAVPCPPRSRAGFATGRRSSGASGASSRVFGALGPSYPHSQLRVASACDARGHLPPQRLFQTALPIVRRRVVAPPLPPRSQQRSPKESSPPPLATSCPQPPRSTSCRQASAGSHGHPPPKVAAP